MKLVSKMLVGHHKTATKTGCTSMMKRLAFHSLLDNCLGREQANLSLCLPEQGRENQRETAGHRGAVVKKPTFIGNSCGDQLELP